MPGLHRVLTEADGQDGDVQEEGLREGVAHLLDEPLRSEQVRAYDDRAEC